MESFYKNISKIRNVSLIFQNFENVKKIDNRPNIFVILVMCKFNLHVILVCFRYNV